MAGRGVHPLHKPADVLALQRLAGNKAVSAIAGARGPVQRQNGDASGAGNNARETRAGDGGQRNVESSMAPGAFTGPLTEEKEEELKGSADDLHDVLSTAYDEADSYGEKWKLSAETFGKCYHNAFDSYETTWEEQKRADKLATDIAFGVLTAVSGGVIGSLAKVAETSTYFSRMPDWQATGILDVMKGAAGQVVSGVSKPEPTSHAVPKDPGLFGTELMEAVRKHIVTAKDLLLKLEVRALEYKLGERPLQDLFSVDPVEVRKSIQAWKQTQNLFKEPPPIPEAELTKELEIGMWANWVQQLEYQRYIPLTGIEWTDRDQPGLHVKNRLEHLGIPVAMRSAGRFAGNPGEGSIELSMVDVAKLVAWGRARARNPRRFKLS